jgi:hypothetical protein
MAAPSLQDGIDQAGSPVRLLWKPGSPPWTPELIEPEYAGWRQEQAAWHEGVSIADLSHHMSDTFIEGPDATRLLAAVSANNYENFAVGQARQFVPVAADGNIVTDGILLRTGEREYILSGVSAAQEWVKYHAGAGGYDVTDPQSLFRGGADPRLFRYQVQGPLAADLVARVFGGPLPPVKFFHSVPVTLAGRRFRALRHNMAGQDGYEFIGDWQDGAAVKETRTLQRTRPHQLPGGGLTGTALPLRARARLPRPGRIGDHLQGGQGGVPLGGGQAAGHRLVDLLHNAGRLEVPVAALVGDLQQDGPAAPLGLALGHPAEVAQMADGERGALRGDANDPGQVGDRPGTARHELAGQPDLRHRDVELGEAVVESAPEHQVSAPDQVADAIAGPGVRGHLRRARQGLPGLSVGHGQESTTLRFKNKYLSSACQSA